MPRLNLSKLNLMNNYSLKMLGLAAGFALFGGLTAQAQDKATLDLLVKKGVITQSDADDVAKSSATPIVVTPKDGAVKGLKLEGMIQAQFDMLSTKDNGGGSVTPTSTDEFLLRRVYLGALADMGNGWNAEVLLDMAGTDGANQPKGGPGVATPVVGATYNPAIGQNYFEKILITKKLDDLSALFSGVVLLTTIGVFLAPIVQRLFHRFHLANEEIQKGKPEAKK